MTARLVEVDDGVEIYTASAIDARFLYREIFTFNGYGELALPPRAFVVDVGANIGMFLLRVRASCPDAEVLAFEPMPALADVVRRNVELRGFADVTLHELALGAAAQTGVTFTYYPMMPSSSTRYPEKMERLKESMGRAFPVRVLDRMYQGRNVVVDVARLADHLPAGRPVDLLKIDTSGSELEVLGGIDPAQWPLIRRVVLDVQDHNGRVGAIRAVLDGHGFRTVVHPAKMADDDGLNFLVNAVAADG